jgi:hypothetical protein
MWSLMTVLARVPGLFWGGLLGLWALESLCWTRGRVWFVGKCFSWIDEVSWTHGILCGSISPCGLVWVPSGPWYSVILSCANLFHPSSVYNWYIHFDRLDEPVTMVQCKLAFGTVYDDAIFMPLMHLLSTISFHVYFGCPAPKARNTDTCGNCHYKALS